MFKSLEQKQVELENWLMTAYKEVKRQEDMILEVDTSVNCWNYMPLIILKEEILTVLEEKEQIDKLLNIVN